MNRDEILAYRPRYLKQEQREFSPDQGCLTLPGLIDVEPMRAALAKFVDASRDVSH